MYNIDSSFFWYKAVFVLELLLAEVLVTYTLRKKKFFVLRFLSAAAVLFGISFALPVIPEWGVAYVSVVFVLLFAASLVLLRLCYDEPLVNLLFCGIHAYTTQHIAYATCYFIVNAFDLGTFAVYSGESADPFGPLVLLVYLSSYAVVYWFVWAFLCYRVRKSQLLELSNFPLLMISSGILLSNIVLNAVVVYDAFEMASTLLLSVFFFYDLLTCLLALGTQHFMLRNKQLDDEVNVVRKLWRRDKEQYELKRENIEAINIKCHDLRHRLREYGIKKNIDDETIREITDDLNIYDSFVRTGNEVLDVILSEESLRCRRMGIKLLCNVDGKQLNCIAANHLYSLFYNAIHNAIDAVAKVQDEDKKLIKLTVVRVRGMISVHVENFCVDGDKLVFCDGLPQTQNADKENHGFGMRSMYLIVQKLGGGINVDVRDDVFSLDVFLPVPDAAQEEGGLPA